jgi:CrcB protein
MHRLDYWLVAGGGALGGVGRFWLSGVIGRRFGETFPWGTLVVNVSGGLVTMEKSAPSVTAARSAMTLNEFFRERAVGAGAGPVRIVFEN